MNAHIKHGETCRVYDDRDAGRIQTFAGPDGNRMNLVRRTNLP